MSKGKKRSGARPGRPQPLRGTKGKRKGARLWYVGGDRKSGSAGMPRPISYAVFCLKKKNITITLNILFTFHLALIISGEDCPQLLQYYLLVIDIIFVFH